jgi:hypothetical protein
LNRDELKKMVLLQKFKIGCNRVAELPADFGLLPGALPSLAANNP